MANIAVSSNTPVKVFLKETGGVLKIYPQVHSHVTDLKRFGSLPIKASR